MSSQKKFTLVPIETTYALNDFFSEDEDKFLCNNFLFKKETYKFDKNNMLELASYIALHYFRINHLDINEELHSMINNAEFKLNAMQNNDLKEWLIKKKLLMTRTKFLNTLNSLKDHNYKTYDYIDAYITQMESFGNIGNYLSSVR